MSEWIEDWFDPEQQGAEAPQARRTPSLARPEREVELPEVPSPARLYAQALGRSGLAMVSATPVHSAVPDVALAVRSVRLDRARHDAYCHLVGERALDVAAPAFLHVSLFGMQLALMTRPDFPLPALGMVHLANRIEHLRGVGLDEELSAVTWARALASRPVGEDGMGTQVEICTEVRSGGETVWQGVSTYLARGTQLEGLPLLERRERPAFEPPLPTGGWDTSRRLSKEYAEVSGDRNPIHTSQLAARAFGFRRTIAHGMDTAARAMAALGPVRSRGAQREQLADQFRWTVELASPVLVPGRVSLAVERCDEDGAEGHRLTAWDPRTGRPHLHATVLPVGAPA